MTKKKIKTKDLWSANMGLPIVWVVTVLTGYDHTTKLGFLCASI